MKIKRIGYNEKAALIQLTIEKDDNVYQGENKMIPGNYNFTVWDNEFTKIVNKEAIEANIADRKLENELLKTMDKSEREAYVKLEIVKPVTETFVVSDYTNYIKGKTDFTEAAKVYLTEIHNIKF